MGIPTLNLAKISQNEDMLPKGAHINPITFREKKDLNFTSRKQMLNYNKNFKQNKKTVLCKNFVRTGYCEFGSQCTYAHG